MTPNKWQTNNLIKLADYLDALPDDYAQFNMAVFAAGSNGDIEPQQSKRALHNCNTCACAVGHGPSAGIRVRGDCSWGDYCERVFGIPAYTDEFEYLFGTDNPDCPRQAAARIRRFVECLSS